MDSGLARQLEDNLDSAPRDLQSRVTSPSAATGSAVGSLGVASFATICQGRILNRSSLAALGAMAGAYADTFAAAGGLALLCIPLALTLRRSFDRASA